MNVFLSMAFHGKEEKEIMERRKHVKKLLEFAYECPINLIDNYTYSVSEDKPNMRPVFLMGESDIVIFDRDWETVEGCRIEHEICEKWNLNTEYIENLIKR